MTQADGDAEQTEQKSDMVFRALLNAIGGGEFPTGGRLPSNEALAKRYAVSRVSVRSALERLKGLGVLKSERGGGTYVCAPQSEDGLFSALSALMQSGVDRMSLFEFRRIIEGETAALAAMRATAEQVDAMRDATKRMRDAVSRADQRCYDVAFHALVAEASANPIIVRVFELMRSGYDVLIEGNVGVMGAAGAAYHEKIVAAVEVRDAALAKALMDEHLVHTMQETRSIN